MKYLVLFRGINVGGNNIIKMETLKSVFEHMGFSGARTYIQSGNVIITSDKKDRESLIREIKAGLRKELGMDLEIIIFTGDEVREIVEKAPRGFGNDDSLRYDVLYFKHPHKPSDSIGKIKLREHVDALYEGKYVIYASRVKRDAGKSYITKIIELPIYKSITIRNWNTTVKLNSLMEN